MIKTVSSVFMRVFLLAAVTTAVTFLLAGLAGWDLGPNQFNWDMVLTDSEIREIILTSRPH